MKYRVLALNLVATMAFADKEGESSRGEVTVKSQKIYQVDQGSFHGNGWMIPLRDGNLIGKSVVKDVALTPEEKASQPLNMLKGARIPYILNKSLESNPERNRALETLRFELDKSYSSGDNSKIDGQRERKALGDETNDFDFLQCVDKSIPLLKKLLVAKGKKDRNIEVENLTDRLRRLSRSMNMDASSIPCVSAYGVELSVNSIEERLMVLYAIQKASPHIRSHVLMNVFLTLDPQSPLAKSNSEFARSLLRYSLLVALSEGVQWDFISWQDFMRTKIPANPFLNIPEHQRKAQLDEWQEWTNSRFNN